jgi:hypothetical protein
MGLQKMTDPEKIEQLRQRLSAKYSSPLTTLGELVRFEMPALRWPFPQLLNLLEMGTYPSRFVGVEYYLSGKKGFIDRLIPAPEYYKFAFRWIAEKVYSLDRSVANLDELLAQVRGTYNATRERLPETGQPSFAVQEQVYAIKSELGNFFFSSRAVMDTVATLMNFLYGPSSPTFNSYADFVKAMTTKDPSRHSIVDDEMKDYLKTKMDWFFRLRDIRDYLTHYKSIDISFYEQPTGGIKVYLDDSFEIHELVKSVQGGITDCLEFMDEHYSKRISSLGT